MKLLLASYDYFIVVLTD